MTEELYDTMETGSALGALRDISGRLPGPFVVIGGWGVYLTVLDSYRREHDVPYIGSRDIDLGFHIDPDMDLATLKASPFARAIDAVRSVGYVPYGSFRYCRMIRKGTGEALTEERARQVPLHDLFYLFIDLMVDRAHTRHTDAFGAKAIDEPILARVFDEGIWNRVDVGGSTVLVPRPHMLLAMKLRAIPGRQKDDKVLKDACDIYALIWHSPEGYDEVLRSVRRDYPSECATGSAAVTEEVASRAAGHLGVDIETYRDVVRRLG
jgi:hypothetical protein